LAETVEGFEKQSRAFINSIEDKALKAKLEKNDGAKSRTQSRLFYRKFQSGNQRSAFSRSAESSASSPDVQTNDVPIAVGARVRTSFGSVGTVEKIDKDSAEFWWRDALREKLAICKRFPIKRTLKRIELNNHAAKNCKPKRKIQFAARHRRQKRRTQSHRTHDQRREYEIDRFLDEAYLAALPRVRIIHGFGTGALKNFVHHFLKDIRTSRATASRRRPGRARRDNRGIETMI
jgi:hypothetical protein